MTSLPPVLSRPALLGTADRFLPVWILAAVGLGLFLAAAAPGLGEALHAFSIGSISVPIAIGLLVMMYPVLAKVQTLPLTDTTGICVGPGRGRRARLTPSPVPRRNEGIDYD